MRKIVLTAAAAFAASSAYAQSEDTSGSAANPRPAPCSSELFRQFDFWVGEWEVFGPGGNKAGDNIISIEENGCLLLERWTSASGGTGQSYNYVDLATNKWRQIWVSPGGTIDYSGGLNDDGAMHLEGEIAYPNGNKADFMGTWTLNEDGTVTQHFKQYNAQTEKWADWFVGTYKKKSEQE